MAQSKSDKQIEAEQIAEVRSPHTSRSMLVLIAVLIILIAGLVAALLWCMFKPLSPSTGLHDDTVAGPCYEGRQNNLPEGYTFYANDELGFRFAYPASWGEVEISTTPTGGTAGNYLMGNFTETDDAWFGGNTTNYVVSPRGGMPTDNPGYLMAGENKYYNVEIMKYSDDGGATVQERHDLHPITEESQLKDGCNATALATSYPRTDFLDYSYDLVRFNLQSDNIYYGVNFVLKNPTPASREQFNGLIGTFELVDMP